MNSTRHWAHVVDARAGPGVKNFVKVLLLNPLNPFQIIFFFEGATSRELSGAGFEAKACVPPSKEGSKQLNLVGRGGSLCWGRFHRRISTHISKLELELRKLQGLEAQLSKRAQSRLQGLRLHRPLLLEEEGDLLRDDICRTQRWDGNTRNLFWILHKSFLTTQARQLWTLGS